LRCSALTVALGAALFGLSACKTQVNENEAIRAGILEHLTSIGTLNMSAMDMEVRSVSINGKQAHAEVEFRPKTGGVPAAGMRVAYNLEKRDGAWVVLKSQTLGGMIQHPDARQSPQTNPDVHSGTPNFNDILNPSGGPAPGPLPPGHPPVNSPRQVSPQTAAKDQTSRDQPH
jgi:hypothetical protein